LRINAITFLTYDTHAPVVGLLDIDKFLSKKISIRLVESYDTDIGKGTIIYGLLITWDNKANNHKGTIIMCSKLQEISSDSIMK
jgi:hypothetical protein